MVVTTVLVTLTVIVELVEFPDVMFTRVVMFVMEYTGTSVLLPSLWIVICVTFIILVFTVSLNVSRSRPRFMSSVNDTRDGRLVSGTKPVACMGTVMGNTGRCSMSLMKPLVRRMKVLFTLVNSWACSRLISFRSAALKTSRVT